jgi:hypothetical protein
MWLMKQEEIFIGFWNRDNHHTLTEEQLHFEVNVLRQCYCLEDYLRYNRKGATVPLNRQQRRKVYGLYQNAAKHALYEGCWTT